MNATPHRRGAATNIITRDISRDHSLVGVCERPVHGDASDDLLAGGRRGDERSRGRPSGRPFA
jgi:hypothetical protein